MGSDEFFERLKAVGDELDTDPMWEVLKEEEHSARGTILVAAEHVFNDVASLLIAYCPNQDPANKMFRDTRGPSHFRNLGLAYALGMLPKRLHHDLEILRNLRNWVAHNWGSTDWSSDEVRGRVNGMHAASRVDFDGVPREKVVPHKFRVCCVTFHRTIAAMADATAADPATMRLAIPMREFY